MKKVVHVLAIDDHVVVLEGYHSIFKSLSKGKELRFTKADDCRSGYEMIKAHKQDNFNIAVLDYSIPPYPEKNLSSGEDMAMLLRHTMPSCRIIMMTMHKEVDIMGRILQNIKPEGFINKSDCSTEELMDGFKAVIAGRTFYSKTISDHIARLEQGVVLEDLDVRIILLLAKGIRNKNLGKYIPLSPSGIEKRKYKIKRLLNVDGDDEALINEARNRGYI